MYKITAVALSIFSLIVAIACKEGEKKAVLVTSKYKTDTLDFDLQGRSITDSFFQKYLSIDGYINLDLYDSGFVLADKIIYGNERILILDNRKIVVCVYNSSGKLLRTLSGGNDFKRIADVGFNKKKDIYILDGKKEVVIRYDSLFKLQYKKTLNYEVDILCPLTGGNFLLSLSSWNNRQNKNDKLILSDSDFNHLKSFSSYNEYVDHNYWIRRYRFLNAGDKIYYNRPIDNSVYVLTDSGDITHSYYFDFGKKSVPDQYKKDVESNLSKYSAYQLLTDFAFINANFALGKMWNNKKNTFFYFDRKKNELFLENPEKSTIFKNVGDFDGKTLVTLIYPGEYNEKDYGYLPQAQKEWLQKGGYVICKLNVQ